MRKYIVMGLVLTLLLSMGAYAKSKDYTLNLDEDNMLKIEQKATIENLSMDKYIDITMKNVIQEQEFEIIRQEFESEYLRIYATEDIDLYNKAIQGLKDVK